MKTLYPRSIHPRMPETRMKEILQVLIAGALIFLTLFLVGKLSQRGRAIQANNYWFPVERPDFNEFITFQSLSPNFEYPGNDLQKQKRNCSGTGFTHISISV